MSLRAATRLAAPCQAPQGCLRRPRAAAARPTESAPATRRRLCACSLEGSADSPGNSEDGYDHTLSRELERRSGKYKSLAAHLDLLYSASETTTSAVHKCDCCRGSGDQECNWCHGTGAMTIGEMLYCSEGGCTPCPVCRGTGQCKCPNCRGTGKRASWLAQGPAP